MPSERFRRLPEAKQQNIWRATVNELKRTQPEQISINRIIKDADISRGSFYTYFSDKKELIDWVIFDYVKAYQELMCKGMEDNNGDLWVMFDMMFDAIVDEVVDEDLTKMITNLVNSPTFPMMLRRGLIENDFPEEIDKGAATRNLYSLLNRNVYPIDEESFDMLIDLWTITLIFMLKSLFVDGIPRNEARRRYLKYVSMLRYGVGNDHKEMTESSES